MRLKLGQGWGVVSDEQSFALERPARKGRKKEVALYCERLDRAIAAYRRRVRRSTLPKLWAPMRKRLQAIERRVDSLGPTLAPPCRLNDDWRLAVSGRDCALEQRDPDTGKWRGVAWFPTAHLALRHWVRRVLTGCDTSNWTELAAVVDALHDDLATMAGG